MMLIVYIYYYKNGGGFGDCGGHVGKLYYTIMFSIFSKKTTEKKMISIGLTKYDDT